MTTQEQEREVEEAREPEEPAQEVSSEEEIRQITQDLTLRLLAAHRRRKDRALELVGAKDEAKEAKERLDAAQGLVNELLDEAQRGPQPQQTELFEEPRPPSELEEATPEDFGFEEAPPASKPEQVAPPPEAEGEVEKPAKKKKARKRKAKKKKD